MRLFDFNLLSEAGKYNELSKHGVMIGELMEGEYKIFLYQMHSFYVELYYHRVYRKLKRLTAFSSTENLEDYINQVDLRDLLATKNPLK